MVDEYHDSDPHDDQSNYTEYTDAITNSKTENADFIDEMINHNKNDDYRDIKRGKIDVNLYGKDYLLKHPTDQETLAETWFLQYLLREANLDENDSNPENRTKQQEKEIEDDFVELVLEYAPNALKASGIKIPESSEDRKELLELLVQYVRKCSSSQLKKYKQETNLRQLIDDQQPLSNTPEYPQLNRECIAYKESDYDHRIDKAALHIVYGIYRTGRRFPKKVLKNHKRKENSKSPIVLEHKMESVEEGDIVDWMKYMALENWAKYILQEDILKIVSFDRADNQKYSKYSIIGLLAHAAVQSRSIREASKTCSNWIAEPDLVPKGGTVRQYITSDSNSISGIADSFRSANTRLYKISKKYSMFDAASEVAFDPTSILIDDGDPVFDNPWMKDYAEPLKGNVESAEEVRQLEVGISALIENDMRLGLGLYPIGSDVGQAGSLSRSIRQNDAIATGAPIPVNKLIMDRGIHGTKVIKKTRLSVGDHWIKLVQSGDDEIDQYISDTPEGETNFGNLDNYGNDLNEKPNIAVVPIPERESSSSGTHRAFLTDLSKDEIDIDDLNHIYRNRRRIETTIQQMKHEFNIPTKNATDRLEFYYINLSMLFFNIYNMINEMTAPVSGLPISNDDRVSPGEVLSAIRNEAFKRASKEQNKT